MGRSMPQTAARFHLYRYQLLPKDRFFQGDLYGAKSIEEVIARKNEIFAEALRSPATLRSRRYEITVELLIESGSFFLYRMAANRSLQHETRDFKTEVIDNWPRILVAIWNDPEQQLVAVQHRTMAFQDTTAVVRLLFESLAPTLAHLQLTVLWEPIVEKQAFWDIVDRHKGKITQITFELVTPNMANISRDLPEDLKEFAKRTNAVQTGVSIESDPSSALKIERTDPVVAGLVNYSSAGGGDIAIRLAGVKKKIHTSRSVKELTIDEAVLEGPPEVVSQLLKELFRQ